MKLSESSSLVDYGSPDLSMRNDSPLTRKAPFALIMSFSTDPAKGDVRILLILAISIILLITAMVGERVTFKMAVDNMAPYRLVLMQLIVTISILAYGAMSHLKQTFSSHAPIQITELPHSKLLIMATLDTIQFAGLILSAAGVSPAMTVILLHSSTPIIVLGSKYFFPERTYSTLQMRGVALILSAVIISFFSSFLIYFHSDNYQDNQLKIQQISNPISCGLYISMAALYGFNTLFKEKSIRDLDQPTDIYDLNSRLFVYQAGIATLLSPFIYFLQGMPNNWDRYPLSSIFRNFIDGISCFFGYIPDTDSDFSLNYDSTSAVCTNSTFMVVGYVICNIVVLECVDHILLRTSTISNNKILERGMIIAVFLAFIILGFHNNDFAFSIHSNSNDDGDNSSRTTFDFPNILAIIVLLIGMEIFGRDPEPDVESITAFVS